MGKAEWTGTIVFVAFLAVLAFGPSLPHQAEPSAPVWAAPRTTRDLAEIRKDTLRVLVLRDPLSWESRPGAESGLEWDLLRRFAKREKLRIKAVPIDHPDSMLACLQRGQGDIIAAQLNPHGPAKDFVHFTSAYRFVAPVRIHLRPDPMVPATTRKRAQGPDTLYISRWSPFLAQDTAFIVDSTLVLLPDTASPEMLMTRVAIGRTAQAVITDASAALEAKRLPQVEFGGRIGASVPLAFGVRTNANHLLASLNTWLNGAEETEARELITKAQTPGPRGSMRSRFGSVLRGDTISPYDSLFQVHADDFHWDWKLLAAVAFKESRFNPEATYKGANGLMQLMPETAASMGIDSSGSVDNHIRTATRYLARLDTMWRGRVPNSDQRMRFVLASYNAGPGHIQDAQRLAKDLGLDPVRWEGNVERALTLLNRPRFFQRPDMRTGFCHGDLTFWYVRDISAAFHGARVGPVDNIAENHASKR
ncbi:MAG TPA: transglycosylase SLT domain-containing protein [Flavobacteriales bacterium]